MSECATLTCRAEASGSGSFSTDSAEKERRSPDRPVLLMDELEYLRHKLADTIYNISGKDDRLLIHIKGHITGELLPKSDRVFFGRIGGKEVTFVLDAQGKVTGMSLAGGDKPVVAARL